MSQNDASSEHITQATIGQNLIDQQELIQISICIIVELIRSRLVVGLFSEFLLYTETLIAFQYAAVVGCKVNNDEQTAIVDRSITEDGVVIN